MKENIKDTLFFFVIAFILWLLSVAMTNVLAVWVLKWVFIIGAIIFIIVGIIAIINLIVTYREGVNKNKVDTNVEIKDEK